MISDQNAQQRTLLSLLALFYIVYLICAILLQIRSSEPPNTPGSVFDILTGSLLWVISITALLFASLRFGQNSIFFLWLLVSAAAGALAIDEVFEFHEKTKSVVGDDDYIKILFWFSTAIGSYILYRLERPSRRVVLMFLTGYLIHTLYLIADLGDGDFFTLPIPMDVLHWIEEILEMLFLQMYLAGFLMCYTSITKKTDQQQAG
jgi:hypothetical protein